MLEPYSTTFLFCRIRCMRYYAQSHSRNYFIGHRREKVALPPIHSQPNRRGEVSSSPSPTSSNRRGEVPSPASSNRTRAVPSPTLGQVVAYFKYQSTKYINQHRDMPGTRIWQRNYYDHVLRDNADLQRIRQYVTDNPMQW